MDEFKYAIYKELIADYEVPEFYYEIKKAWDKVYNSAEWHNLDPDSESTRVMELAQMLNKKFTSSLHHI